MKAFKVTEVPTWTIGIDCSIIFADSEKEANLIADEHCDSNSKIEIEEIPIEKGFYYIGGHIE